MHFISAYAPTDAAKVGEKRKLYKQLKTEVESAKPHDETVLGGDMNAEAGEVQHELIDVGLPYSVGRCGMTAGFAIRSENARLFAEFLAECQLLDVSSIFKKRWATRWTFQGSFQGGRRRREYGHLMVRHRDRGQAAGFDVATETHTESDHRSGRPPASKRRASRSRRGNEGSELRHSQRRWTSTTPRSWARGSSTRWWKPEYWESPTATPQRVGVGVRSPPGTKT